jgi:hypothetical protein
MTSEEISRQLPYSYALQQCEAFWLKEIAYQIAIHNEREEKKWDMAQSSDPTIKD